jgi:hypothetical protein
VTGFPFRAIISKTSRPRAAAVTMYLSLGGFLEPDWLEDSKISLVEITASLGSMVEIYRKVSNLCEKSCPN